MCDVFMLMSYLYFVYAFTALYEMQTRSSDENSVCLSVRLSVCPSVCLSHA